MGRAIRISYRWERTWYISTICAASRILRVVRRVIGEAINDGGRASRPSSRGGDARPPSARSMNIDQQNGKSRREEVCPGKKDKLDLATARACIAQTNGPEYWRRLETLAGSAEFHEMMHREFPKGASEWLDSVSRRGFLKLMGASMALAGMTACTKQPLEPIVPYVRQPEEVIPGRPLFFATAFTLSGYASPVLVESHLYRPTKIEGNAQHPASLGGTDVFAQASILDMYDPDRSQNVMYMGDISTWSALTGALQGPLNSQKAVNGSG